MSASTSLRCLLGAVVTLCFWRVVTRCFWRVVTRCFWRVVTRCFWRVVTRWPGLPEVVGNAVGGEQPPKRHLDPHADPHVGRLDVGELDRQPLAVIEVDDREHHGRALG